MGILRNKLYFCGLNSYVKASESLTNFTLSPLDFIQFVSDSPSFYASIKSIKMKFILSPAFMARGI